jgi:hypothetical protein
LPDELKAKIQELGDLAKVNHDSARELFENYEQKRKNSQLLSGCSWKAQQQ